MGDRANVYVHENENPGVYLYTHWAGTELPETVRTAIERAPDRWNDIHYLTRVIFCEMVGDDTKETTGYGIGAQVGDGDDRIVDVDVHYDGNSTVTISGRKMTFKQFIDCGPANWR